MQLLPAFLTILAAALLPVPLSAQEVRLMPPQLPLLATYQYWPTQYIQWLPASSEYAMIELDVDPASKPVQLYLTVTSRASGRRVHYTNDDGLVAYAKSQGDEAHKANISFEDSGSQNAGATSSVRLTLADGRPLQWRFVQGSDISEQGSGLTPLPDVPTPVLVYREQGAVAGEGTVLQIGTVVLEAEVWKEISHPPQFVAYRGALTSGAHTLAFTAGRQDWTVVSTPTSLAVGDTWKLSGALANERTLTIKNVTGEHITVTGMDRLQPNLRFTMEATHNISGSWHVDSVRYAPIRDGLKHSALLQFGAPINSGATESLTVTVGKKRIASANVSMTEASETKVFTFTFTDPNWLHGKTMTEAVSLSPTTVTLSAHP